MFQAQNRKLVFTNINRFLARFFFFEFSLFIILDYWQHFEAVIFAQPIQFLFKILHNATISLLIKWYQSNNLIFFKLGNFDWQEILPSQILIMCVKTSTCKNQFITPYFSKICTDISTCNFKIAHKGSKKQHSDIFVKI